MKAIAVPRASVRPIGVRIPSERGTAGQSFFRWWPLDIEPHRALISELRDSAARTREHVRLRWSTYLKSIADRGVTTSEAAGTAQMLWKRIARRETNAPLPNARPTEEKGLRLSWNRAGCSLEILVNADGRFGWFYTDTNDTYDAEDDLSADASLDRLFSHFRDLF